MTVTYVQNLATSRKGAFLKLLLRWKASVYKELWPDLIIFLSLYYILRFLYSFVLEEPQKRVFEFIVEYCEEKSSYIPLSFVLGFYITIVMDRWWSQFLLIPWPDNLAISVTTVIEGQVGRRELAVSRTPRLPKDDRCRLLRRTIMRYVHVGFILAFRDLSTGMKKRFQSLQHIVDAGFLQEEEMKLLKGCEGTPFFVPLVWACTLVQRAHQERYIKSSVHVQALIDKINDFRGCCGFSVAYNWINVPLIYTQVVTLAVYSFFLSCLMGRQFVHSTKKYSSNPVDIQVPVFTILMFLFYMGWLKVAATLVNPYGEDDDDFEINYLLDRHLTVSYMIVDEMHDHHPTLIKDQYWDETYMEDKQSTLQGSLPEWMMSPFTESFSVHSVESSKRRKASEDKRRRFSKSSNAN